MQIKPFYISTKIQEKIGFQINDLTDLNLIKDKINSFFNEEQNIEIKKLTINDNLNDFNFNDRQVVIYIKPFYSQKIISLYEKTNDYKNKITELNNLIIERAKNEKSKTKKCKSCESIINKDFLKSLSCPICSDTDFLITETDKKRYESYEEHIKKYSDELNNELNKENKNVETHFVYFYNFPINVTNLIIENMI